MKCSIVTAQPLITLCKAKEKLLPPPERFLLKSRLEKCPDCELRLEELKEPSLAVGGHSPVKESGSAAAHSVPDWSRAGDRQSPALGLSFALHSGCSRREVSVCWQHHRPVLCWKYFLKGRKKKIKNTHKTEEAKNEQLYHYLLCWDLGRDQLKDPYCLQQLMSLTSAEAVLSLKVLTYLQFSVLSLALICHFKMNAPFVQPNHLHEHSTSSKSEICFAFPLAAILYFGNCLMQQIWKKKPNYFLFKGISLAVMSRIEGKIVNYFYLMQVWILLHTFLNTHPSFCSGLVIDTGIITEDLYKIRQDQQHI